MTWFVAMSSKDYRYQLLNPCFLSLDSIYDVGYGMFTRVLLWVTTFD